ncbi:MAG: hypothetical protein K1000chlam3_00206 [Chlamydiae bacterium]|nr:hypothetical protein [Chlamydiota bacterium]
MMQEVEFEGRQYRISFDTMPHSLKEMLSSTELKKYLELLEAVQKNPRSVYAEIKTFGAAHSDVPEVINLLTFAHIQNHQIVEAEKLIADTFQAHPEYLFARINYADQCIRKKKLEMVPKIFPTFDLKKLCPEKEVFHTSEFRGFLIMMTYYYKERKMREKTLHYFEKAKEIEPHHPSVLYLEKKLFKKPLWLHFFGKKK